MKMQKFSPCDTINQQHFLLQHRCNLFLSQDPPLLRSSPLRLHENDHRFIYNKQFEYNYGYKL